NAARLSPRAASCLLDHQKPEGPDRFNSPVMSFVLRDDGCPYRTGRQRNQHVVDDRVAGFELKAAFRLQLAEDLTGFYEHLARGQEDPSGFRECRLDTLHEAAIPHCERARAELHQDDGTQMLDAFAREQDLFVTAGVEPVDVDVGINDEATHLTRRSAENFLEPSFGCYLTQRSIDVRLRDDETEGSIERLGFCGGLERSFRLVEFDLVDANVLVPNRRVRHPTSRSGCASYQKSCTQVQMAGGLVADEDLGTPRKLFRKLRRH